MRTVYLGTSAFAVAVLERLAASPHAPALVVTRPDRPRGRGRTLQPPPVADVARALGLEVIQPERLHDPDILERIAAAAPDALCVCAYGVLIREPLLSAYEILNVHPSLLPRWRGAAPIERAIMAGDAETGVSIMRLTAGLDSGPVCLQEAEPIRPDDDYATLAARLERLGGELLVRALDERPAYVEQDEARVTYAEKIGPADRSLDFTRRPETVERTVRALRPHIGARLPLPAGGVLGVVAARVDGATLAPAGGRVRVDADRLLLDCRGGALELTEIRPPGGKAMPAAAWLRGRPDPALVDFRLDPALPDRPLDAVIRGAIEEWGDGEPWAPCLSALAHRGSPEVLDAARALATESGPRARMVAAYAAGRLGVPARTMAAESAAFLEDLGEREGHPDVLRVVAEAFGALGEPWGTAWLLRSRRHPDAVVRDGVATALAGRENALAVDALAELSTDRDPLVRGRATFGLGALAAADGAEVRDALAARLGDGDVDVRIEAVYGLAVREDDRAVEPALALLAAGERGSSRWSRHALGSAAERLAARTGDPRFAPHVAAAPPGAVG